MGFCKRRFANQLWFCWTHSQDPNYDDEDLTLRSNIPDQVCPNVDQFRRPLISLRIDITSLHSSYVSNPRRQSSVNRQLNGVGKSTWNMRFKSELSSSTFSCFSNRGDARKGSYEHPRGFSTRFPLKLLDLRLERNSWLRSLFKQMWTTNYWDRRPRCNCFLQSVF